MNTNNRQSDNELNWLVKANGNILGPFSFNQVLVKLTSGEFQPNFEVSEPMRRWRTLQAQPLFSAAIEKIRIQSMSSGEFTHTKTEATSFTRTLELTVDKSQTQTADITAPDVNAPPMSLDLEQIINQQVKSRQETSPQPKVDPNLQNPYIGASKKNSSSSIMPWIVGVSVLVVVAVSYVFLGPKKGKGVADSQSTFLNYMDESIALRKHGRWQEALKVLKKAYQIEPKDADLVFQLTPLMMQLEGQSLAPRSFLERTMQAQYKQESLSVGFNLMGLTYSYEDKAPQALEFYGKAIKKDPSYIPAKINKAFSLIVMRRYVEARDYLQQSIESEGAHKSIAYLYLLESYLLEAIQKKQPRLFEGVIDLAQKIASAYYDGRQEAYLFAAYAASRIHPNDQRVVTFLNNAFNVDPEMTANHLHSSHIDWRGLSWGYFSFVCDKLQSGVKGTPLMKLRFVCSYHLKTKEQTRSVVKQWSAGQRSIDSSVADALVEYRGGDYQQALAVLKVAATLGTPTSIYYKTMLKVCVRLKDQKCIDSAGQALQSSSPLHYFYARAISREDHSSLRQGLNLSPGFLPLIRQAH